MKSIEKIGQIQSETELQRYMDFTKFVALLDQKRLFFSKASMFEDELEGSTTPLNAMQQDGTFAFLDTIINGRASVGADITSEVKKRESDNYSRLLKTHDERSYSTVFGDISNNDASYERVLRQQREWVDVNCWHANENESMAMWKIYGGSSNSVCLVTTVQKLCSSLQPSHDELVLLAKVEYISHKEGVLKTNHLLAPFFHKAHFYSFENEYRLLCYKPNSPLLKQRDISEYGTSIQVDLPKLVHEIRVASNAQPWFRDLVQSVVYKYGLNMKVVDSTICQKPIYNGHI